MNLAGDLIPLWLGLPALAAFLLLAGWNVAGAPWALLRHNQLEPVFAVACGLLAGLWSLSVGAREGLEFHLLGLTAMVLIFGWRLALVGGAIALGLLTVLGINDWQALGVNGLIGVALPVWLSHRLGGLVYHWLPRHLFVYIIVTAHFAAMLASIAVIVLGGTLLALLGAYPWSQVTGEYFLFMPLVILPEGFINGALMTMLAILKPEWVRSFDDHDYLIGK